MEREHKAQCDIERKHWKDLYKDAQLKVKCTAAKTQFRRGRPKIAPGALRDIAADDEIDKSRSAHLGLIYYEQQTGKFDASAHGKAKHPVSARDFKNQEKRAEQDCELDSFLE